MTSQQSIIEALLRGSKPADETLDALLADLPIAMDLEIAKEQGMELTDIIRGCERRLDVLGAMALLVADDPAMPWERAGLFDELGREAEAAQDFLEAASRADSLIETGESDLP